MQLIYRGSISLVVFFFMVSIMGCKTLRTEENPKVYYDLEKTVSSQVDLLTSKKASLIKTASLDDNIETVELTPDSLGWATELQLFASANINKPNNQGLYKVIEQGDTNSNLTKRTFTLTEEKGLVPYMEIFYLDEIDNIVRIELVYNDQNPGFDAYRQLEMTFEEHDDFYLLKSYEIRGFQKVIGMDSVQFVVSGEVKY